MPSGRTVIEWIILIYVDDANTMGGNTYLCYRLVERFV
jgi:hypothetical protein